MRCVCGCWDDDHELIEPGEEPGACTTCGCDAFAPTLDEPDGCDDPDCTCHDLDDEPERVYRPVVTLQPTGGRL